jgi:hypothetical protein
MPDLDHDIRTYFDALADEIVGEGEFAQPIQLAERRGPRRLPRALLAVAALAAALGIAGVIASSLADDAPSTQLDITDDPAVEPQPDAAAAEAADGSAVVVLGERAEDSPIVLDFSVPWKGGTLTLANLRVLGPAPEDVLEHYPPEIAELWADGLPATWEEADAELQTVGLQQLGFETAEADPVLRRWFLDASPTQFLTHTVNGVTTEIPFDGFGGETTDIQSIDSNGERLAVAGPGEGPHVVVSVTEDLETWTAIELVDPNPPGVPAGFVLAPANAEVTVSDWGWAVIGTRNLFGVDPDYLVSLGLIGAEDPIISVDVGEAGVLVVETANETLRLTETDLGLPEGSGILDPHGSEERTRSAWAAPWGGEPSSSQLPLGVANSVEVSVSGDATGLHVTDVGNETSQQFATTGDGWYPTNPAPGGAPVSAGIRGLVSGQITDGELGAEFWVSEDLGENWRSVEVLGLEGHTSELILDEWPILKTSPRRDFVFDVDGYRVVLTAWFLHGEGDLFGARLEDSVNGELLAEQTFVGFSFGSQGFEFVDASGNVLVEVDAAMITDAVMGDVGQTEALAYDGPSWQVDTTNEPWVAVPITR